MARGLQDRVALITGGARGIGAAAAQRLAEEGSAVVIVDLLDDEGEATASAIRDVGGRASFRHLDVVDEVAWAEVIAGVVHDHAGLHILVNNAGTGTSANVEDETFDGWANTIAITQTSVWLGMKHAGPAIKRAGGGSIINMSSILGTVGWRHGSIAYQAAKGAVRMMTKNAAILWASDRVRVNSIHPGFIETPMTLATRGTTVEAEIFQECPMGRWGTAEEVAAAVAFLASDDSSFVTGIELHVDGGWTAQ